MTSKIGVGQASKTADHKPLPMMLGISYDRLPVGSNGMMTHTKQRTAGDKPPKMFLGGIGTEPDDVEDKKDDQSDKSQSDEIELIGDLRRARTDHRVDVGILATTRLPAAIRMAV